MRRGLACRLLLLASFWPAGPLCGAEADATRPPPAAEDFLSSDCVAFFRFDGVEAHRRAFEQTAVGELMRGDLGTLVDYLGVVMRDSVGPALAKQELLGGKSSDKLKRVREGFDQVPGLLRYFGQHGVVVGVEATGPLHGQVTLVFPGGGERPHRDALTALFRLAAGLAEIDVRERKLEGRTISELDPKAMPPGLRLVWWPEGNHLVATVGTEGPDRTLAVLQKKTPALSANRLYRAVQGFKDYETMARGFADLGRMLRLVRSVTPPAAKVMDALGLDGVGDLTMQFGYEGRHERSTLVLRAPGPRKGLLRILSTSADLGFHRLPPVPPDAAGVTAVNLDLPAAYDAIVAAIDAAAETGGPQAREQFDAALRRLNQALSIDLKTDLLDSLAPTVVLYNSPSEGALTLGRVTAFRVRDEQKLRRALDRLSRSLPAATGADVAVRRQSYRGAAYHTVHYTQQGFFPLPSYTIHQGWLVVAAFPQPVQGFILRTDGRHQTWQPTQLARDALAAVMIRDRSKSRPVMLSVADPRPAVGQLCALAPLAAGLVNSFVPGSFDVTKLPSAQALTEPLFPNVTVLADDGDALRVETYASLSVPLIDLGALDTYALGAFALSAVRSTAR